MTILPLIVIGMLARLVGGMNFVVLSGFLAGSVTSPAALAFANTICRSEAPSVAYAAVYPLTMVMRILAVQMMAMAYFG